MTEEHFQQIYSLLKVRKKVHPVAQGDLDSFADIVRVTLPASYQQYCHIFGAGEMANSYNIAVPGYTGKYKDVYDLATVNAFVHDEVLPLKFSKSNRFEQAIFFADDSATAYYFWKTSEVTAPDQSEYTIYAMFRDYEVERVADSFWEFIDVCLHRADKKLYDDPPDLVFVAA